MRMLLASVLVFLNLSAFSQSTSWKGTASTSWSNSLNWTNGVPSSTKAAVIGDISFANAPTISGNSACAGLTVGGANAVTLTINKNLTVSGPVTINANGTIRQGKAAMTITGNWTNNGTYTYTANQTNTIFSGQAMTLSGTSTTTFKKVTISTNAFLNVSTAYGTNVATTLNGTLIPASGATLGGNITVNSSGTLKVTASTFAGNYTGTVSLGAGSTVEYNSASAQTISSSYTYSTLRITGSGVRTVSSNLNALTSSAASYGNIYVDAGTLDLQGVNANRGTTTTGGTFSVANGATLKLSGSNFPINYNAYSLSYTSTVEYYGAAQTVSLKTYGNLVLSGSGIKTLPATAFSVANAFTTAGSITANANAGMTVSSGSTLGSGTTFNAGNFAHTLSGNLVNNGTINGGTTTGTISIGGAGSILSGSGAFNFNNLTTVASGVSSSVSAINVAGNLATTGSGVFTHTSGTITMTGGATKTISGSNITLNNLTVSAAGVVSATSGFNLTGNLAVSGSFSSSGILVMNGSGKSITGGGVISINTLSATGTLTANTSFTIGNTLDVTGSLTATACKVTFNGTCLYNGTSNLDSVTLSGTSSLQLAANSTLGIAAALTIGSGTFNTATTKPNTVIFNGAAQNVPGATYDNLVFSGGAKTATGALTVTDDITINNGASLAAGAFSHIVQGNWINNGGFTAGGSTVSFTGTSDATLTGATTFNILTINKTSVTNSVFLANDITTPTLNMTSGVLRTTSKRIIVTSTINFAAGSSILGTIERAHALVSGTDYPFESAQNLVNFTGASGVNGVTVTVATGNVSTFPFGAAINRSYTISVASGTYTSARLRLHYEDVELNGNNEASLQPYRLSGSWTAMGSSGSSSSGNYVEQTGLSTIAGSWTLSATSNVVNWNGSQNSDWNNPNNWSSVQGSPSLPPSANDIVQIGAVAFGSQPTITTAATAKSILFGSAQAVTLTLGASGSLTTQGNISGSWSSNVTHTLNVGAQTLTVNGNILLSDGTSGHAINLGIGTGTVALTGSLTESGGANINFTGAGNLNIGGDFTYSSGTFTPGSGTVTYNGGNFQAVGGVTYNQLVINKTAATATAGSTTSVNGNLTVTAGTFDFSGPTTIAGDVTIANGAFATNRTTIQVSGNWFNNGTYLPNGGTATFTGSGNQSISATSFNKIVINKTGGTATLTGNLTLNSDLLVQAGTLNLSTFTANRNTIGGTLQVTDGAALVVGGSNNFPANYTYYTFGSNSTTTYNGTGTQTVSGISYGNLVLTNGGSNAKTLAASTSVLGNLSISSGATLNGAAHNLSIYGNWSNSGTFTPATGAVLAMGSGKTITGNSTFNKLTVYGSYTVAGSDITFNGALTIVSGGTYNAGAGTAVLYGNLTNSGTLTSSGSTTFAGTQVQTIQLINALVSTSTGIINFEGTFAPVLNSTSTPTFGTLNIRNTGGISPSVAWNVLGPFTIANGASFNGGVSTHTIAGNFTNNGVVTSSGILFFNPSTPKTANLGANSGGNTFSSTGTVNFGGSAALTVSGTPTALANVTIGNTAGVAPSANWSNISGNFTIADNSVFNAGSNTYTLAGDFESAGTLNGGTSRFVFTSATAQMSGSPNTSFYDLTVNSGAVMSVNSDFNVSHDLTINGSIDAANAGVTFNGAMNGNLTGSAASLTLADFDIEKSSGYSLVLQKNVIGVTDLNITSGNLDMGILTITQDAVNTPNTLTIENNARLRIAGSSVLPAFTQYVLDSFSIVEYYGGAQALTPTVTYGSVEITAGAKSTSAGLTLLKHMTITGGSLAGGAFTHNVGGNWTQTGGSFATTGIVNFNGVEAQTVSALSSFNQLTLNNTFGLSLASNVAVAGNLVLTAGKATLGAFDLSVTGNITSSSTNYLVATGNGALVLPLAASGSKLFPVGTTNAYLPATVAFTAGSTGDNISVRVLPAAYLSGTNGGVLTNYAVNATWMISEAVAGGSNATITVQWPASRELPQFSRGSCRFAHYTGSSWDYGTVALNAGGSNPYTVSRSNFTSFSPFSVRMLDAVLPVTWTSFTGQRRNGSDELQWRTATETNNAGFTVEESRDGRSFTALAQVAGAGNSSSEHSYSYTRRNAQGAIYYRIKQTDFDGNATYTSVIRLTDAGGAGLQAVFTANPVRGNAQLQLSAPAAGTVQLSLFDAQGRKLWSNGTRMSAGTQTVQIPMDRQAAGIYFVTLRDAEGAVQTLRVVKE
ncbi:MAG: hypothetical protein EOO08_07405 [Chitinophagaceae bacterium]|nr:MAG: hypothetical protein EOO08_07405 [Chitinophagaceae bacterium]